MNCHDCDVQEGKIHKRGCDMERCPFCGDQLITCTCSYNQLQIDCSPGSDTYKYGLNLQQGAKWTKLLDNIGRIPYILYPNICGRCGKLWPDMFDVSNTEWSKYIQLKKRHLILCLPCFSKIKELCNGTVK